MRVRRRSDLQSCSGRVRRLRAWPRRITAKFDVLTLVQGLPRTTEFLVKLIPPIGLSTFAARHARVVLGPRQVARQPAEHAADGVSRHRARHDDRWFPELLRRAQPGAALPDLLGDAPGAGDRAHRSRHRVGAAVHHRIRHRSAGRHPGHHRPYDRRAGKAVRRSEREHQPAADRRHPRCGRELVAGDPLRACCRR